MSVPRFTDSKIEKLNQEIALPNVENVGEVIAELRNALKQHIQLARESLEARASAMPVSTPASESAPASEPPRKRIIMVLLNGFSPIRRAAESFSPRKPPKSEPENNHE